tara:strand:- start:597 stop:1166 length:570 start_codon:yes stop_codon:yes gene_type:complete
MMAIKEILKGLEKVRKKIRNKKGTTTTDRVLSKDIGKNAADVTQPADVTSLGKVLKGNDPGALTDSQSRMGKTAGANRAYKSAEKEKIKLQTKLESLSNESKAANKINSSERIKKIKEIKEQKDSIEEQIKLLETRMSGPKGLEARYPIEKSYGGRVKSKTVKRASGGSIGCGKAMRGLGKGPYKKKGM